MCPNEIYDYHTPKQRFSEVPSEVLQLDTLSLPKQASSPEQESVVRDAISLPLAGVYFAKKTAYVDFLREHAFDPTGAIQVDDPTKQFVQKMVQKAVQIRAFNNVWFQGSRLPIEGVGQAGVIMNESGQYRLVTAKHTIADDSKKKTEVLAVLAQYAVPPHDTNQNVQFKEQGTDIRRAARFPLRDGMDWKYGFDVDSCPVLVDDDGDDCRCGPFGRPDPAASPLPNFDATRAFAKVPPNFECQVGQQVAIVVSTLGWDKAMIDKTATCLGSFQCTEDELKRSFAPTGGVALYKGRITYVGRDHIEYDINTVKGFSGAIVFLWDHEEHRGKAIAVHVGFHPLMHNANIGLKINRMADDGKPSYWTRFRHWLGQWTQQPALGEGDTVAEATRDLVCTTVPIAGSVTESPFAEYQLAAGTSTANADLEGLEAKAEISTTNTTYDLECHTAPSTDSEPLQE